MPALARQDGLLPLPSARHGARPCCGCRGAPYLATTVAVALGGTRMRPSLDAARAAPCTCLSPPAARAPRPQRDRSLKSGGVGDTRCAGRGCRWMIDLSVGRTDARARPLPDAKPPPFDSLPWMGRAGDRGNALGRGRWGRQRLRPRGCSGGGRQRASRSVGCPSAVPPISARYRRLFHPHVNEEEEARSRVRRRCSGALPRTWGWLCSRRLHRPLAGAGGLRRRRLSAHPSCCAPPQPQARGPCAASPPAPRTSAVHDSDLPFRPECSAGRCGAHVSRAVREFARIPPRPHTEGLLRTIQYVYNTLIVCSSAGRPRHQLLVQAGRREVPRPRAARRGPLIDAVLIVKAETCLRHPHLVLDLPAHARKRRFR